MGVALSARLVIVTTTTVTAFYNLIWIRGETLWTARPIFFILSPLFVVVQHAVALISISAFIGVAIIQRRPWQFADPIRHLLGSKKPRHDRAILLSPGLPDTRTSKRNRVLAYMGKLFATLLFIAQCVTSIVLYWRRVKRDGAGPVDRQIFSLALSGLFVGFLTLGIVLRVPFLSDPVATTDNAPVKGSSFVVSIVRVRGRIQTIFVLELLIRGHLCYHRLLYHEHTGRRLPPY